MSFQLVNDVVRSDRFKFLLVSFALAGAFMIGGSRVAQGQAINEDFASLTTLLANGWATTNHSQPLNAAVTGWSQCGGTAIPPAQGGVATACVLVNFQSGTGVSTLNNWLIGPNRTFNNGDTISFYTRTPNNNFPDRMQVRLSSAGTSTNVGTLATDVGDFSTLLLDIDPTYLGIYPTIWTQFTITLSGLSGPTSGRFAFRYFVENGGPSGDNSNIIGVDTLVYTPAAVTVPQHFIDYNGDGLTDYSVVRNNGGALNWYNQFNGGTTFAITSHGVSTDVLTPADFDGDTKTDIAVWRSGAPGSAMFLILRSSDSVVQMPAFGQVGDIPIVAKYDADALADLAIFRPATATFWHQPSSGGVQVPRQWGLPTDKPVVGDIDGDGKGDQIVARNNGGQYNFWIRPSGGGADSVVFWGLSTDTIVPGDYDGDGKTDLTVVRTESGQRVWYVRGSLGTNSTSIWGVSTDLLVPGDYDGDGKTDPAIYRGQGPSTTAQFWSLGSLAGPKFWGWGLEGDTPAASSYNVP